MREREFTDTLMELLISAVRRIRARAETKVTEPSEPVRGRRARPLCTSGRRRPAASRARVSTRTAVGRSKPGFRCFDHRLCAVTGCCVPCCSARPAPRPSWLRAHESSRLVKSSITARLVAVRLDPGLQRDAVSGTPARPWALDLPKPNGPLPLVSRQGVARAHQGFVMAGSGSPVVVMLWSGRDRSRAWTVRLTARQAACCSAVPVCDQ
jgi:hypothetical protein